MSRTIALSMSLMLILLGVLSLDFEAQIVEAGNTIKAGDWIKYNVTTSPMLEGEEVPTWMKFEFTNIEGTNATVKATIHLSSGQEMQYNGNIDVVSGSETGLVIPSNSAIGDSVHIAGYKNITIEEEATLAYTGVNRTVVKATFSNSTDYYAGVWDKQTGIRLEDQVTKHDSSTSVPLTTTTIFKISNTNIWQTRVNENEAYPYQNIFYAAIILLVVAVPLIFWRIRMKKPQRRIHRRAVRIS
jgi:hypothetical protein